MSWNDFKEQYQPDFHTWIKNGLNDEALHWVKHFARHLSSGDRNKKLTTSKLRKFFGEVKRLQVELLALPVNEEERNKKVDKIYMKLKLLPVKLAYDVGREKDKNHKIVDFYHAIDEMIDQVEKKEFEKHFSHFVEMFEAVVAYFKAYEEGISI